MLFQLPALDADDTRVLSEIDRFYAGFAASTGGTAPREWLGGLRRRSVAGAVRGSNSIEGYVVDAGTASAVVAGAAVPASVPEDTREAVTGYRDALSWVLGSGDLTSFTHSEALLSLLHFTMMRFFRDKSPGRYRRGGIMVTGSEAMTPVYVGPGAEEVPALMGELVDWLDGGDLDAHPFVRAAMAHLNLAAIHPWRDGNGRMSRCVQTLVIARSGRVYPEFCSIEEWLGFELNTMAYYAALQATQRGSFQPANDAHGWIRFSLRAHHEQTQIVDRRLRLAAAVWQGVEQLADRLGLHRRTAAALYEAATDQLRRETYQRAEGVTRDQSIRDIRGLEKAGLITPVGYGTTLHYVAAGELKQLYDDEVTALTAPLVAPYPS